MKVYSDYIAKYNRQQTLKIISNIKKEIYQMFNDMFKLIDVDAPITCNINEYFSDKRIITFDNNITNRIIELTPYINNYLIKLVKDFELEPGMGVICYHSNLNRDIQVNPNIASYSFSYTLQIKYLLAEINETKINNLAALLIKKLNELKTIQQYGIKIPKKINITTINKLYKQYPLIDKKLLINEVCNKLGNCLIFQTAGNNKHQISYLENKIGVYGENVCSYYIYNKISNSVLNLFTIYSIANKNEVIEKIKSANYKLDSFENLITNIPESSDQIGIEFNLTNYLTYVLEKYSVEEVISCPENLEWNKEQNK